MIIFESIILFIIMSSPVWCIFVRNSTYVGTIILDLGIFLILLENQRLQKENKDERRRY